MPATAENERTQLVSGGLLPGYDIRAVIGTGGFGTVVQARQLKLDRIVAIKIVELDKIAKPALAARFESEAITLGKFHHPNIVQVHDFAIHDGRMFIAMELLEGEDLGQRLRRAGPLDERTAWAIARQTASALSHAAAQGVVHRDIKPTNLFLIPAPTGIGLPRDVPMVKVTDFGLALTKWAVDAEDGRLTAQGTVLGTPVYMAPEQYRGTAELDHRVDLYALGATVYHCLAGHPPFGGATIWDVMVQKLERTPTSWPRISADSIALLTAMLAPDPQKRLGSYEDLIERIDALPSLREAVDADEALLPITTTMRCPVISPTRRRNRWLTGTLAAGVVAAAAVAWSRYSNPTSAATIRFVSRGDHQALFDYQSMAGWLPSGGVWRMEEDDEQANVIAGNGLIRRTFPAHDNYRITLGLDVAPDSTADIHFGLSALAANQSRRFVLRVSRREGAVLGTMDGNNGVFRPISQRLPFPEAGWFEGRRPYLEVRIERTSNSWAARFNGQDVGRTTDGEAAKAPEIRIHVSSGRARIDSAVLERLESAQ